MYDEETAIEKRIGLSILYDFYGQLLKENQKEIFEDYILNDYSLSEIAEQRGISRQGVHDAIKRCGRQLSGFEERLHLAERFKEVRMEADEIKSCVDRLTVLLQREAGSADGQALAQEIAVRVQSILDRM